MAKIAIDIYTVKISSIKYMLKYIKCPRTARIKVLFLNRDFIKDKILMGGWRI